MLRMSGCCDIINTVMKMEEKKPERKPTRIKNYDYSSAGAYFITICTKNRAEILSNIGQHSSVSRYVSTFKRFCNKEYGENIWQESFFDHIIRNNEDYEEHIKYIHENPIKWYYENK